MKKKNFKKMCYMLLAIFLFIGVVNQPNNTLAATPSTTKISMSNTSLIMYKGTKYKLSVKRANSNVKIKSYKWYSTNSSVAKVGTTGRINALSTGTATIKCKVTWKNNKTSTVSCTVKIKKPVAFKKYTLNKTKVTLNIGEYTYIKPIITPTNASVIKKTYSSSNTKVAAVYSNGKILGKSEGTVKITCTIKMYNNYTYKRTCTVKIVKPVPFKKYTLNKTKATLKIGEYTYIKPIITPTNASVIKKTYSSSNTKVAAVYSNGKVVGKTAGTVQITCTIKMYNNYTYKRTCTVKIIKPTEKPTEAPTEKPTEAPTEKPTEAPTEKPTEEPTEEPTEAPTEKPTETPTEEPTEAPTEEPTEAPTEKPTEAPTEKPTEAPTEEPTEEIKDEPLNDGLNLNEEFGLNASQISSSVSTTEGSNKIVFYDIKDFKVGDGIALKEMGAVADDDFKTWLVAQITEINGNMATLNVVVNETKSNVEVQHDNSYNLISISDYYRDKDKVEFYCSNGEYNLYSHAVGGKESIIPTEYGGGSGLLNLIKKDRVNIDFDNAVFKNKSKIMLGADRETRLYSFMVMKNCNNVTVKNLTVDHDTKNQLIDKKKGYEYWTYGVAVHGGKDIVLQNIICNRIESDGIYISHHRAADSVTLPGELSGISLINCKAEECGRQGLSVGGGNNIRLTGCEFTYTGIDKDTFNNLEYKSSPSAGIDFELETGQNGNFDRAMYNVNIKNCKLTNNAFVLAGDSLNGDLVTFENCELSQVIPDGHNVSTISGLFAYMPSYAKTVMFKGCRIEQYSKETKTNSYIVCNSKVANEIIFDDCIIKGIGYIRSSGNTSITIKNSDIIADSHVGTTISIFDNNDICAVEDSRIIYSTRWLNETTNLPLVFNKISNSEYIFEDCEDNKTLKLTSSNVMEHVKLTNKNHNNITLEGEISTYLYNDDMYMYKNDMKNNIGYEYKSITNDAPFTGYNEYSTIRIEKLLSDTEEADDYKPAIVNKVDVNGESTDVNWTLNNINDAVKTTAVDGYIDSLVDYIDYTNGKYVRYIGSKNVNDLAVSAIVKDSDNNAVYINTSKLADCYMKNANNINYFCNKLNITRTWIYGYNKHETGDYLTNVGGGFSFHLSYDTLQINEDSTNDEIKAAFSKWAADNKTVMYYELKTPEIIKFKQTELKVLDSNTFNIVTEM